jgi:hypothetical protein
LLFEGCDEKVEAEEVVVMLGMVVVVVVHSHGLLHAIPLKMKMKMHYVGKER